MLKKEAIQTFRLSLPIILGELTQMSLGLINSAMVGRISYRHLAAASLVNSVMNIPFIFGIGMTMSISQTVATSHGRHDEQKVSHYLYNGFLLSAITAVIIALVLELVTPILFHLKQDPAVAALGSPYFRIIGWSVIPMILFLSLKQFTDGLEYTHVAMTLSMLSMPLNVLLDWALIFGHLGLPRLELVGAAYGTLITRTLIFIILAFTLFIHPKFKKYIAIRRRQWQFQWQTFRELLHIGLPSSLQALLEIGAFAVSGIIVGTFGSVNQAAHQIALQAASFTFMVSMGLAQGCAIRIGNAYGQRDWDKINAIGKSTFYAGLLYGCLCAVAFMVFRYQIPHIFNDDTQVVQVAANLMFLAGIFQISDATQAIAVGTLRGMKDVTAPTYYMAFSYWAVGIPLGMLLAYVFHWNVYGIWTGFVAGLTLTSILLNRRIRKLTTQG